MVQYHVLVDVWLEGISLNVKGFSSTSYCNSNSVQHLVLYSQHKFLPCVTLSNENLAQPWYHWLLLSAIQIPQWWHCLAICLHAGASGSGGFHFLLTNGSCCVRLLGGGDGTWWRRRRACWLFWRSSSSPTWTSRPWPAAPDCWSSAGRTSWSWPTSLRKGWGLLLLHRTVQYMKIFGVDICGASWAEYNCFIISLKPCKATDIEEQGKRTYKYINSFSQHMTDWL